MIPTQKKELFSGNTGGYVPRNFEDEPLGSLLPKYTGKTYSKDDLRELSAMHEKNESSPLYWHRDTVKIKNQKSTNFCWMFGTVAGVETQYGKQGHRDLGLSPASTACMTLNFQNNGGWGSWACEGINEYGIATYDKWPNVSFDRSLPNRWDVKANMEQHDLHDFEDLGKYNFMSVASALLDEHDPAPCTGGFTWWGHLVLLLHVGFDKNNEPYLVFANSWGTDWGTNGYGVLTEDKMNPYESIRIGNVKPRSK